MESGRWVRSGLEGGKRGAICPKTAQLLLRFHTCGEVEFGQVVRGDLREAREEEEEI